MQHQPKRPDHERLKDLFAALPKLDFSRVRDASHGVRFKMPTLAVNDAVRARAIDDLGGNLASQSSVSRRSDYTLLDTLHEGQPSGMNSMPVLVEAIDKASGKLEYGRTAMKEWKRRLVFVDDSAVRGDTGRLEIMRSESARWSQGQPINRSRRSAHDWFKTTLLPNLRADTYPHGIVVHGMAGSGKSTLLKYLILKNYPDLRAQGFVFSRFELMKFWKRIEGDPEGLFDREAGKYMAVTHARDLLIHRFCTRNSDGRYCVDMSGASGAPGYLRAVDGDAGPAGQTGFNADLEAFIDECAAEFDYLGKPASRAELNRIREVVSRMVDSNARLVDHLEGLKLRLLHGMIFVLARGRTLVTVYDGLDAVRPEDILSTAESGNAMWDCACRVMRRRATLGAFDSQFEDAPRLTRHSILVTRNNTLTGLQIRGEDWADRVTRLPAFQIAPIAVMPAAISTARTVISYVPELRKKSPEEQHHLADLLLRPYIRSMGQIFHDQTDEMEIDKIEDLFDGNLRKLFRLLSLSLRWTREEMLSGKQLDSQEYQTSAQKLLEVLASDRGISFLRQKSYRAVETLLVGGTGWFENAVVVARTQLPGSDDMRTRIQSNTGHHGVLDNILNYHVLDPAKSVDGHMMLEKVRYLQILREPMGFRKFRETLSDQLGYSSQDKQRIWTRLLFLMKTGFLIVETSQHSGEYRIKTSRRGKLALRLLSNLGYVENVFHQTLFPEVMVETIHDQTRGDAGNLNWAARSIRNAFVFLTYFKCLEENALGGQPVPPRLRMFADLRAGLVDSIDAMTAPTGDPHDETPDTKAEITRKALQEIDAILAHWRNRRLIAPGGAP